MKTSPSPPLRTAAIGVCAFIAAILPLPAFGDLYSKHRPLRSIDTEYFTIVFPDDSEYAAGRLAGFADDTYMEVASLLETRPKGRITVVITPDEESVNGYYSAYPYPRIVIYEAAVDPASSLGSFDDDLRSVFKHELTHAVSLSIRSPIEDAVVRVFGSPFGLSSYLTPPSFVEGVTVSFESLSGHGRASDPMAAGLIRQDIIEDRWKSFDQAAGAYDAYPGGSLYYIYGGYFSKYLQERYGMDRYAALWRGFGSAALTRPLDDWILGPGRFSRVYGLSLSEAWEDFRLEMSPKTPIYMAPRSLVPPSSITTMSSFGGRVVYADSAAGRVFALEPLTGASTSLLRTATTVTRLDASPDASRMLVSTIVDSGGFGRLSVREWLANGGRLRELEVRGIRDAAYLGTPRADAEAMVVAVKMEGFRTDLVAILGNRVTTLIKGGDALGFSSPVASADGTTVYALARLAGEVSVIKLGLDGRPEPRVVSIERLLVPAPVAWIRYLSLDGSTLRFAWDDGSLYRLAELDGPTLRVETVPISGGVHWPIAIRGADGVSRVHYLGKFSEGVSVCALPPETGPLGFVDFEASWVPWDGSSPDEAVAMEMGHDASTADRAGDELAEARRYSPLRWALPRFWYPTVSLDLEGLESAGFEAFAADPVERLETSIAAAWNLRARAVDASIESSLSLTPLTVSLELSDAFQAASDGSATRLSGAQTGFSYSASSSTGPAWSFGAAAAAQAYRVLGPDDPRYGAWSNAFAAAEASASISDLAYRHGEEEAAKGYRASLTARFDAPLLPSPSAPSAGLEANVAGSAIAAAASIALHGAVSLTDGLSYGPEGRVYSSGTSLTGSYPAWAEFEGGAEGAWFLEGEAGFRLLGVELQRGLGRLYANRLSIRTGARAYASAGDADGVLIGDFGWSAWASATLAWTPAIGAYARLHPRTSLEFWYRPDRSSGEGAAYGLSYTLAALY